MKQAQRNIAQALEKSQQLLAAAELGEWENIETLIKQRDHYADIAFTDDLDEALYSEAKAAFEIIREQQQIIGRLADAAKNDQLNEVMALNKNKKGLQAYEQNR